VRDIGPIKVVHVSLYPAGPELHGVPVALADKLGELIARGLDPVSAALSALGPLDEWTV